MIRDHQVPGVPKQGYWVRPSVHGGSEITHGLGGANLYSGAECPNCRLRLILLFDFDAVDARLELQPVGLDHLPLLWCWSCSIPEGELRYRLEGAESSVRVVEYTAGPPTGDPYEGYSRTFPRRDVDLIALSEEEQDALIRINATDYTMDLFEQYPALYGVHHQVGGEPWLLQSLDPVICSVCGIHLPLFASVGNNTFSPNSFMENDWVQVLFHVCRPCGEIVANAYSD